MFKSSKDLGTDPRYPVLLCSSVRRISSRIFFLVPHGVFQCHQEEVKVTMAHPTTGDVVNKITTGEYTLYPTRVPLLGQHVSNMMNTIQRQLLLQPGQDGAWTEEAQGRLVSLLAKPKVLVKTTPLPIEDKKSPPPQCKSKRAQLAIEYKILLLLVHLPHRQTWRVCRKRIASLPQSTTHGAQMDCLNFAVSMSCLRAACLTKTSSACLMRILVYLHSVA